MRVGVLSLHNSKETKAVCNAVADLGHDPVWLREENLIVDLTAEDRGIAPDVDVVVNRLLLTNRDHLIEDLELANVIAAARPTLNAPGAVLSAVHKFATAMRLREADVPVPPSYLALHAETLKEGRDRIAGEAVQKANVGTHGETMWRVEAEETVYPTIGFRRTLVQRFLEQEGEQSDIRAYVVGDEILGAMRRTAAEGSWRTNVAQEGTVDDVTDELPDRVLGLAREATAAVGLDVAGVDLMREGDDWYVLEVNPTAGFRGFFEATGVSPAPHIARHAIERAGGAVDDEAVERVETTLDDSVPACKPDVGDGGETPTLGYTASVRLNAPDGPADVEARVDTGAARTSIDIDLAADIEAGPIRSSTDVRSAGGTSRTRPLVDVEFAVSGDWERVTASVEDRSNMRYDMLLGRDVLDGYTIDPASDGDAADGDDENGK